MKKEKVRIIILILFITISTSINIVSLNKSNRLLGSIEHSEYLKAENVGYNETTVQASINDLLSSANTMNDKISNLETNIIPDDIKVIKNSDGNGKTYTSTGIIYLGTHITIPAGYYAIIIAQRSYSTGSPTGVYISRSESQDDIVSAYAPSGFKTKGDYGFSTTYTINDSSSDRTYYLLSSGDVSTNNTGRSTEIITAVCIKKDSKD